MTAVTLTPEQWAVVRETLADRAEYFEDLGDEAALFELEPVIEAITQQLEQSEGGSTRPGDHVVLVGTTDEHTRLRPGQTGVVQSIDDLGTVFVAWDPDGHVLGLVPGVDVWRKVHPRWWDAPLREEKP